MTAFDMSDPDPVLERDRLRIALDLAQAAASDRGAAERLLRRISREITTAVDDGDLPRAHEIAGECVLAALGRIAGQGNDTEETRHAQ